MQVWWNRDAERILGNGLDFLGKGSRAESWRRIGLWDGEWMVRTVQRDSPSLLVSTITASSRLLCNKKADIMVGVACGMKTRRAHNAAVIKRAISGHSLSNLECNKSENTHLHRKQLSPFLNIRVHGLPGIGGSSRPAPLNLRAIWTSLRVE